MKALLGCLQIGRSTCAALLVLASGWALPAAAQNPPSLFGEVIDVKVINIEVVVTQRGGERVTGLGPEDFILEVDGRVVPIEFFSEIDEGQAREPADRPAGGSVPAPAPLPVAEGRVPTRYLVYIDESFSIAAHRNRVLSRLREQVSTLGPGDSMAIIACDGSRLAMISNWSTDRAALQAALDAAAERPSKGAFHRARLRSFASRATDDIQAAEGLSMSVWIPTGDGHDAQQRAYIHQMREELRNQIRATQAAMRALSGVEGRKVLLLLSGGWPDSLREAVAGKEEFLPSVGLASPRMLYEQLTATANLLGYTVYPVDVPGIATGAADASAESPGSGGLSGESNLDSTLKIIARETGGRPMLNSLRDEAFRRAAEDTRSYYWLGFTAERAGDGQQHEIEVRLTRPGLQARFRKGYLDRSRQEELVMAVEGSLLFGQSPSPRPLPFQVGELQRLRGKKVKMPLVIGIPVDEITIIEMGEEYVAELELQIGVIDSQGTLAPVAVLPVRLASRDRPAAGKMVRFDTSLELRRDEHDIVLALFDPATGNLLSSRFTYAPEGQREQR